MLIRILLMIVVVASTWFGLPKMLVASVEPMHHHQVDHTHISDSFGSEFAAFTSAMEVGMEKMMVDMHQPGFTGNPDVDFLTMMIPHHEGAVEMARLVLLYGRDPLVRQLASEIIASQQVEIAAMQSRLPTLRQGADFTPGDFPAINGNRGMGIIGKAHLLP